MQTYKFLEHFFLFREIAKINFKNISSALLGITLNAHFLRMSFNLQLISKIFSYIILFSLSFWLRIP